MDICTNHKWQLNKMVCHSIRKSNLSLLWTPLVSPGVPCSEADYKRWSPSDEHGNECLLGREITFKRRAPHATCFNGEEFDRPVTISNCSCTRQDYEWSGGRTRPQ